MEDSKTLLFYLLSVVGLIVVSILFAGRPEEPGVEPLPATAIATKSEVTPSQLENQPKECASPPQKMVIGYIPEMAALAGDGLILSGTVYAADFVTPLPGAWIEVWPESMRSQYPPYSPYERFQTDGTGQYEVSIPRPDRDKLNYIHYWVSYPNSCPLLIEVNFIPDPAPGDPLSVFPELGLEQTEMAGSILRGSIDIVLPIPPPITPTSLPVELTETEGTFGEKLTISGTVYAADCLTPLSGILIEVWHADPEGHYSFASPSYFRGKIWTDAAGHYEFTSLKPARIYRHFHQSDQDYLQLYIYYRLSYQDQEPLLTRLSLADDLFLKELPAPSPGLTISLIKQMGPSGPEWQSRVNLRLPYGPERIKLC
jgi:protocatechuate 3,4-dioxygenase beta subunit